MFQILLTALTAGIIAQLIKPLIGSNQKKFNWQSLSSYSGMPSSHAAFVAALTAIVGLTENFNSPLFAVCFIFSVLVIRDALGLRRHLGQQGEVINILVGDLKKNNMLTRAYPELQKNIGHTSREIIAGSALGILISLISYYFF